jgi:hypothetical protein
MGRRISRIGSFAVAALLVASGIPALADGGLVRVRGSSGAFVITVFTSPTPMRAGPVDVSVMVQDGETGRPVLDALVVVEWTAAHDDRSLSVEATRERATNKLLYAALPELPRAGDGELRARVSRAGRAGEVSCRISVLPSLPPLLSFWPYLVLPPVGVLLFVLNRRLAGRRLRSRRSG